MIEHRRALLQLLEEEDPDTFAALREQLLARGPGCIADLRSLLEEADDPMAALHIQELITELEAREVDHSFACFCSEFSDHTRLEDALWRLAATFSPGEDFTEEMAHLDQWAREAARRLQKATTPLDRVETLAEYLGDDLGLRGNEEDYYAPENSLLQRVVQTRLGIPISLCMVYILVGQRAGLEISGVNLPGHFLARHEDVFFDPFHGGRRVTLEECKALLLQQDLVLRPEHLQPPSPRQILIRILTNLFYACSKDDPPLAAKVAGWIEALRL